jgi:2-oxoglutarate dehydrogenase E1 component
MSTVQAISPSVNGWSAAFLEAEYERFKADPASVPPDLRAFLQGFDLGLAQPGAKPAAAGGDVREALRVALGVRGLIDAYRTHGHLHANLNPFGNGASLPREAMRPRFPESAAALLDPAAHGLKPADLARPAFGHGLPLPEQASVEQVLGFLKARYCASTAWQFMHLADSAQRAWWAAKAEETQPHEPTHEERLKIVEMLCRSAHLEGFLQKRYQGQKRFSLEGGESLIPLLEFLIRRASDLAVDEIVLGMAHRGRINVLTNVMGKTYQQVFTDFEHNFRAEFIDGGGDVKYHKGYSTERPMPSGRVVHLSLASNPSHLEAVNAVVCGRARGKQRLRRDTTERRSVMAVLIHGDAAVCGQGVVGELLNMSRLKGYTTGGTVHVVTNNLVGFTTDSQDGRSSVYCTDFALGLDVPVLHVNGDDPESVVRAAALAVEFRQAFGRDVFVDLYCYRKYGHNEQDNASFTQPVMAELIKADAGQGVLARYAQRLESRGHATHAEIEAIESRLDRELDAAQELAKKNPVDPNIEPGSKRWSGLVHEFSFASAKTAVSRELLTEVCAAFSKLPEGFTLNPTLKKLYESRAALAEQIGKGGELNLSYADAETLAYGTLLLEGTPVRISGQDARRGTFSHRHAVARDFKTAAMYTPLNAMRPIVESPDDIDRDGQDKLGVKDRKGQRVQARLCVYDSPLSEFAVMGFDYGYSMADPHMLVCWEAQFGDFVNGAQVMIDQFLASAEIKWGRWSGLTLLLPHGYEGAGPEHSSARLERFLQLCADDNLQVVYPSTGAQIFHLLRRQVRRNFRKPLVVMTPKSMLRPMTSRVDELVDGRFMEVLDDPRFAGKDGDRKAVTRVVLCCGKVYHELAARRDLLKRTDLALVRIEQLYPLHGDLLKSILAKYPAKAELAWCQEEPRNAGAYLFVDDLVRHELGLPALKYFGRAPSATPAVGDTHASDEQQEAILAAVVGAKPGQAGHGPAGGHAPGHNGSAHAAGGGGGGGGGGAGGGRAEATPAGRRPAGKK